MATTNGGAWYENNTMEKPRTWIIRTVWTGKAAALAISIASGVNTAGIPGAVVARLMMMAVKVSETKFNIGAPGSRGRIFNRAFAS